MSPEMRTKFNWAVVGASIAIATNLLAIGFSHGTIVTKLDFVQEQLRTSATQYSAHERRITSLEVAVHGLDVREEARHNTSRPRH